MTPIDKLRSAIETYSKETGDDPNYIITDFVVAYSAVDIRDADTKSVFGYATSAARHVAVGMTRMLDHDLMAGVEGDD